MSDDAQNNKEKNAVYKWHEVSRLTNVLPSGTGSVAEEAAHLQNSVEPKIAEVEKMVDNNIKLPEEPKVQDSFASKVVENQSFQGKVLDEADFHGASLINADFSKASLKGA